MAWMVLQYSEPMAYVRDENAAEIRLQKIQGQSNDWARQYGGWKTAEAPPAPDNTTHHMMPVPFTIRGEVHTLDKCVYCDRSANELRYEITGQFGATEDIQQYQCVKAPGTSQKDREIAEIQDLLKPISENHPARPDDSPEPGDRCKDCGKAVTWIGPSQYDWEHVI